jgi:hypothetical protein
MSFPYDDAGYATEQAQHLFRDLTRYEPGSDARWAIAEYLLQAYRQGYRRGLENGHKTTWKVIRRHTRQPIGAGALFEGGLSYEVALQVMRTANRVHPNPDFSFDLEPEERE